MYQAVRAEKRQKKILEWLQLRGDVEVMKPALHEDSIFKEGNPGLEGQRSTFSQNIKYADDALKILDAETSVKKPLFSSLDGKKRQLPNSMNHSVQSMTAQLKLQSALNFWKMKQRRPMQIF